MNVINEAVDEKVSAVELRIPNQTELNTKKKTWTKLSGEVLAFVCHLKLGGNAHNGNMTAVGSRKTQEKNDAVHINWVLHTGSTRI